jgi:hypothetical protein
MKKLIIAAVVVLMSAQAFAGPIITIKIEIGKKSLGCDKFGWCSGTVGVMAKSTIQIDEKNTLLINLDKESAIGKEDYLTGSYVTFDEAFTLSSDILRALGSKTIITVKQGKYPLTKTSLGYLISIPLNNIDSIESYK